MNRGPDGRPGENVLAGLVGAEKVEAARRGGRARTALEGPQQKQHERQTSTTATTTTTTTTITTMTTATRTMTTTTTTTT